MLYVKIYRIFFRLRLVLQLLQLKMSWRHNRQTSIRKFVSADLILVILNSFFSIEIADHDYVISAFLNNVT